MSGSVVFSLDLPVSFFSILGFRCRIVLDLGNSFIGWIEFIYLFSNRSFPPLALNFESFSSLTKRPNSRRSESVL